MDLAAGAALTDFKRRLFRIRRRSGAFVDPGAFVDSGAFPDLGAFVASAFTALLGAFVEVAGAGALVTKGDFVDFTFNPRAFTDFNCNRRAP